MKITEALSAEHLVFHNLFDHIEATAPGMKTVHEVQMVAAVMESLLKAHSDTEDDLFIGPMEHCFEQYGQRDAFLREHQEMDGSLQRIRQSKSVDEARRLLMAAVAHSRQHFDKEERLVFPMAERMLKAETLEALGKAWMEQRDSAVAQ
jgi:hemerythrin-like domain-containing protein